jgi:hypothetical protein
MAASDKMRVVLKTYAADGENGLHAHPNEDQPVSYALLVQKRRATNCW